MKTIHTSIHIALLAILLLLPLSAWAQCPVPAEEPPHKKIGQRIAEKLESYGVSENMTIVAISTLPIVELRGAIPVGHIILPAIDTTTLGDSSLLTRIKSVNWKRAGRIFALAVIGNMIPVPFILFLLGPISRLCMKVKIGEKFFTWLFARTRRKSADIEKYETLGLTIFVAIPLPATGAWTGAMAAWLLGMSIPHSLAAIFMGVLIAGVIMTALSLLGWIGVLIASVALSLFGIGIALQVFKKEPPHDTGATPDKR